MAVKARAEITLSSIRDVEGIYRYYLLQSSTLSAPSKPTTYPPPEAWDDVEPAYDEGETNSLYTVDCNVYSDGTWEYTDVSLSTSYEAAKAAYNKADAVSKELVETSSEILQTSENITMSILAGYTTTDDLEKYKQEIENTFNINEQGFAFQFAQMEEKLTELGNTVTTQNSYIRLENGEIIIGQTGETASPITTVYTNTGMEIRFNGVTVARYTDGVMEINNAYIGNQLAFWKQFAFRKGAYITDVGYNLNLVWIGG